MDIQLKDLAEKLKAKEILFQVDAKAKKKLAEEGYDPDFGARPLRRLIQREIQDPLSLSLLEGKYKEGGRIVVSVDDKTGDFKL